jgi:hypothetical protein
MTTGWHAAFMRGWSHDQILGESNLVLNFTCLSPVVHRLLPPSNQAIPVQATHKYEIVWYNHSNSQPRHYMDVGGQLHVVPPARTEWGLGGSQSRSVRLGKEETPTPANSHKETREMSAQIFLKNLQMT